MAIKIIIILLLTTQVVFGQVVLHRYTDIVTSEERGICYSSKDGVPAIDNPDWNVEIIDESQKEYYIKEQRKQLKAKADAAKAVIEAKRKDIKDKLKALGFDQSEVDLLVGESN